MRIVIAGQGDGRDPATWSGIPLHLGQGLEAAGASVTHVNADAPRRAMQAAVTAVRLAGVRQPGASHGPELAALRTRVAARRLRATEHDLIVQVDTGFVLPPHTRYVTLHDMTVAQATGVGWSDPALMGARPRAAWERRDRDICRRAVSCCTAGDWAARSVVADYGVAADRVHTVGFGANAAPAPAGRDWSVPRYLFVGREWERKNGPAVLDAFAAVRRKVPGSTLTLVGGHPPVSADGVHGAGPLAPGHAADRAQLVALFEQSTCFVLPSLMEPFGIAYVEAGMAGVPSIGTTVGGAATAIGDGGTVVDPADGPALVEAMLRLSDPAEAQALGARAEAHAARYTWEAVARRLLAAVDGHA